MKRLIAYAACLAIVAAVPVAHVAAADRAGNGKTPSADQKFLKQAAQDGLAEVELGRLATARASSDAVKKLGDRMMNDHTKANDELAQLAQQKGVTVPTTLDSKHKREIDRLSKLSGDKFDHEYVRRMVRDHDKDVKTFQRESQRAKDADVKAWAAKTLPVLQEHQQQVHQLSATLGGSTSGSASPRTDRRPRSE